MERISKRFPVGLRYDIPFDTTRFVDESINEVIKEISGFAKEKQTVADVGTAFSNSAKLVDNLGKAVGPILDILRDVGTVAAGPV